ncbi:hypothetical protein HHK36_014630 [Tetracentron sinense]|uniref:ubiquitinyl hydrolase 1 n=1 Tax=Tetracentron sinense TaxID=13715 RepID=A0A834Z2Z5_TETSI|nr:hypothetical protein HHK36_014630 [Tetracentron sinense]
MVELKRHGHEGPSNGGMLYHEVQESKLCAVHCVNTVLQGPFFSEFDLAELASYLDRMEQQMMLEGGTVSDDFFRFDSEESHNVSMDGDFSIQVLQKALEVWDLQVTPLNCPVAEPAQIDPELENSFICHSQDHWFCIRKVDGEWYNLSQTYSDPSQTSREEEMLLDMEDEDLKAAIAASLMDSAPAMASSEAHVP